MRKEGTRNNVFSVEFGQTDKKVEMGMKLWKEDKDSLPEKAPLNNSPVY